MHFAIVDPRVFGAAKFTFLEQVTNPYCTAAKGGVSNLNLLNPLRSSVIYFLLTKSCDPSIGGRIANHSATMVVVRRRGDLDVDILAKIVEESE